MSGPTGLLLFDVDLTLIRSGGAGLRALRAAFSELFGVADAGAGYRPHGMIDRVILRDLLERHHPGDPPPDAAHRLESAYLTHLERTLAAGPPPVLMPGVPDVIDHFERHTECVLGLLTGNLRRGAQLKLASFPGLFERFATGAFGDDHDHHRHALVDVARTRAATAFGRTFADHEVVVIGDTPRDVDCARRAGVVSVAVAAGDHPREALADADLVVDDLTDPAGLAEALGTVQAARSGA